jgi:hypothetical protein
MSSTDHATCTWRAAGHPHTIPAYSAYAAYTAYVENGMPMRLCTDGEIESYRVLGKNVGFPMIQHNKKLLFSHK